MGMSGIKMETAPLVFFLYEYDIQKKKKNIKKNKSYMQRNLVD